MCFLPAGAGGAPILKGLLLLLLLLALLLLFLVFLLFFVLLLLLLLLQLSLLLLIKCLRVSRKVSRFHVLLNVRHPLPLILPALKFSEATVWSLRSANSRRPIRRRLRNASQ